MNTDKRGKHGLLSRPLVPQNDDCAAHSVSALSHRCAQSFCTQSPKARNALGRRCTIHFPLSQSNLAKPSMASVQRMLSLRTIENIKDRKNCCSKCGILWKLYLVDLNTSKSTVP